MLHNCQNLSHRVTDGVSDPPSSQVSSDEQISQYWEALLLSFKPPLPLPPTPALVASRRAQCIHEVVLAKGKLHIFPSEVSSKEIVYFRVNDWGR